MTKNANPKPEPKRVWMKCRASEKCEGQYAYIVFSQNLNGIYSMSAGRVIRYKCCTCGHSFHIRQ